MDQNTQVIWNFLLLAYKNGFLEKNLQILQGILDPKTDLGLLLASMEDSLSETGKSGLDLIDAGINDKAVPLLKILSDENFMQGARILLDILQPTLERIVKDSNYDMVKLGEKITLITRLTVSLKPVTMLMAPALIDLIIKQKPAWTIRFVLRRIRKKILKIKRKGL